MKKARWIFENILFVLTLFLLAFIPLYPKLPILDVSHTWVYVRAEDFVVMLALFVWVILLLRRKVTLRTPLTMSILLFWIVGTVATIHGVLLIFPYIANVFPNVAFLSMLRRIEYLSLFFVAYAGIKEKRFLSYVIVVLTITLFCVALYGFGQKYVGFPAYLTMNEEFAKGVAIQLSSLSRVPSTFGGHYDLGAYLVFIIPILTSMVFAFRTWPIRIALLVTVALGFGVLIMTVSRISLFALLVGLALVLFFQKKRFVLLSLPVLALLAFVFLSLTPALLQRFGNTIKEIDVLVDGKTGETLGQVKEIPSESLKSKVVKQKFANNKNEFNLALADQKDPVEASASAVIPFPPLPPTVFVFVRPNAPNGEDLPQGTGYINLALSPVTKRFGQLFYEKPVDSQSPPPTVLIINGDFLIKRASAYDLSFTTRFQGEWPHAIEAFRRNIFFGSGYGSISLAIDNNYLRLLGEVGLLGIASFFAIFITLGIYIKKVLPDVDSPQVRSFVLGFVAGLIGLGINSQRSIFKYVA